MLLCNVWLDLLDERLFKCSDERNAVVSKCIYNVVKWAEFIFFCSAGWQIKQPGPQLTPDSEEYMLQLLSDAEQKMMLLKEDLQGKDLATVMKEMEENEVRRGWFFMIRPWNHMFECLIYMFIRNCWQCLYFSTISCSFKPVWKRNCPSRTHAFSCPRLRNWTSLMVSHHTCSLPNA